MVRPGIGPARSGRTEMFQRRTGVQPIGRNRGIHAASRLNFSTIFDDGSADDGGAGAHTNAAADGDPADDQGVAVQPVSGHVYLVFDGGIRPDAS